MDRQGAPILNFHHYTLKNSELAKNWPSSGPRLSRISTFTPHFFKIVGKLKEGVG